jgi:cell wall-associated NlpC family hydrolase
MVVFFMLFSVVSLADAASGYQQGDSGQEVAAIQTQLKELGYNVGYIDGDFGSMTTEAIKAFQKDHGLDDDGVVGSQTYRVLMGREVPVSRDGSSIMIRRIMQTAMRYTGVSYVFGGSTPDGFDCSGFVQYVFARSGVSLPRTADQQYDVGQAVSYSRLQPGDLVFFTTYASGASHVGIYLGNGRFISATSSRGVVIDPLESRYWGSHYIGARRIL